MQFGNTKFSKTFIAVSSLTLIGTVAWCMGTFWYLDDFFYQHVMPGEEGFWNAAR